MLATWKGWRVTPRLPALARVALLRLAVDGTMSEAVAHQSACPHLTAQAVADGLQQARAAPHRRAAQRVLVRLVIDDELQRLSEGE